MFQIRRASNRTIVKLIGLGIIGLHAFSFAFSQFDAVSREAEAKKAQAANIEIRSEVTHIGAAEVKSMTQSSGLYPALQPEVYWHDQDWNIDLLPISPSGNVYSLSVRSGNGSTQIVKLSDHYSQIRSISLTPNNKAIVVADINGKVSSFGIVDLKLGKMIDDLETPPPSISPNRRFIVWDNYDEYDPGYDYRLYDTLKTPLENSCGFGENDPEHKSIDSAYRGFPIYPRKANQVTCLYTDDEAFENEHHAAASDFIWSSDSSKVVFVDRQDRKVLSLILVTMATGINDIPQTSTYRFIGVEDVCAGAANCGYNNVRSIAWDGDTVNVALIQANPTGKAIEKDITIPLSKFVPIGM